MIKFIISLLNLKQAKHHAQEQNNSILFSVFMDRTTPYRCYQLGKTIDRRTKMRQAIQGKNAMVGVAFSIDGQLFTFNDEHRYPLMSVFKLHVAIAALQKWKTNVSLWTLYASSNRLKYTKTLIAR